MALKTFNVDAKVYDRYSKHCKKNGVSMSKQIDNFLRAEIEKMNVSIDNYSDEIKKAENRVVSDAGKRNVTDVKNDHPLSRYC